MGAVTWEIESCIKQTLAEVKVSQGCLLGLLFVPVLICTDFLQWGHASRLTHHSGVRNSLAAIRQRFWWLAMATSVGL